VGGEIKRPNKIKVLQKRSFSEFAGNDVDPCVTYDDEEGDLPVKTKTFTPQI
jgi:hypothetical protein